MNQNLATIILGGSDKSVVMPSKLQKFRHVNGQFGPEVAHWQSGLNWPLTIQLILERASEGAAHQSQAKVSSARLKSSRPSRHYCHSELAFLESHAGHREIG